MDKYCAYEEGRFPEDQFESTREHGWVHKVEPRHDIRGNVIDDKGGELPGTADLPVPPAEASAES